MLICIKAREIGGHTWMCKASQVLAPLSTAIFFKIKSNLKHQYIPHQGLFSMEEATISPAEVVHVLDAARPNTPIADASACEPVSAETMVVDGEISLSSGESSDSDSDGEASSPLMAFAAPEEADAAITNPRDARTKNEFLLEVRFVYCVFSRAGLGARGSHCACPAAGRAAGPHWQRLRHPR
jgi:hypothetical protein